VGEEWWEALRAGSSLEHKPSPSSEWNRSVKQVNLVRKRGGILEWKERLAYFRVRGEGHLATWGERWGSTASERVSKNEKFRFGGNRVFI